MYVEGCRRNIVIRIQCEPFFIKEKSRTLYLFLFPARVLGPGSLGARTGEEGGEVTAEDDVLDVSN